MRRFMILGCTTLITLLLLNWWLQRPIPFYLNEKPFQQDKIFGSLSYKPINTLYVSPQGNNQNSGSLDAPIKSIQLALDQAKPGTHIHLLPGNYSGPFQLKHSGTSQAPIILEGSGSNTSLSFKPTSEHQSLLQLTGQHLIIRQLTLKDVTTDQETLTPMAISIEGNASHIALDSLQITNICNISKNGNAHGIGVYGQQSIRSIRITNNQLSHLVLGASEGIALNGDITNFLIADNQLSDTNNIGIDIIGFEGTGNLTDWARNGKILNNTLSGISSKDNPAYNGEQSAGGIYIDGGQQVLIEGNQISNSDIGIEVASEHKGKQAKNILIRNNSLDSNYFTGIALGGYNQDVGGITQVTLLNNNLTNNGSLMDDGQLLLQAHISTLHIEGNRFIGNQLISSPGYPVKGLQLKENHYQPKTGHWLIDGRPIETEATFLKQLKKQTRH